MNVIAKANTMISNGQANDAIYVSNCLDEIIKQLTVSRQNIDLFYSLYVKMLDRLFGEDVTNDTDIVGTGTPPWVKGGSGGWLRVLMSGTLGTGTSFEIQVRSAQLSYANDTGPNASYVSGLSSPLNVLMQKFTPYCAMFDILAKIQGGYELNLALLPTKLQMYITEHPVYHAIEVKRHYRLCHSLLKTPLHSSTQRNNLQHKNALMLDSIEYFLVCLLRYPTMSHDVLSPSSHVNYAFHSSSSIRRPNVGRTTNSSSSGSDVVESLHRNGIRGWMRGIPYLALLQEYLKEYLPLVHRTSSGTGSGGVGWDSPAGAASPSSSSFASFPATPNSHHQTTPGTAGASNSSNSSGSGGDYTSIGGGAGSYMSVQESTRYRYKELFVLLAIEFWIDPAIVLRTNHHKQATYKKLLSNVGAIFTANELSAGSGFRAPVPPQQGASTPTHPSPTEVVLLDSSSLRWTVASMQCTYLLVLRVLADANVLTSLDSMLVPVGGAAARGMGIDRFPQNNSGARRRNMGAHAGNNRLRGGRDATPTSSLALVNINMHGSSSGEDILNSTGALWATLQVPVYNMLQCIFVKSSSSSINPLVVSLAIEVWLLWLQPWNAYNILNSNSGILRVSSSSNSGGGSRYSDRWQPYIAANLHFYTTLLTCYFRMVTERSLSVQEPGGLHNLVMLERVQQAFDPMLLVAVDSLHIGFRNWFLGATADSFSNSTGTAPGVGVGGQTGMNGRRPSHPPGGSLLMESHRNAHQSPVLPTTPLRSPSSGNHGSGGGGAAIALATPIPPEMLQLLSMQHEALYPDRNIDYLTDAGITDFRLYASEACINLVSSLFQMNENLTRKQDWLERQITKFLAEIRHRFGLPQPERPRHRHSARLVHCMHSIVRLVPASAAGMTSVSSNSGISGVSAATSAMATGWGSFRTADGTYRDPHSGQLTELGRRQLVEGKARCHIREIIDPTRALTRDPLESPLCSYEWKLLALWLISCSKLLNSYFQLPRDPQNIMCSWYIVWCRARQEQQQVWFPAYPVFLRTFRFNLRCFARYRVFCPILLLVVIQAYRLSFVSLLLLPPFFAVLGYVMYENYFPL